MAAWRSSRLPPTGKTDSIAGGLFGPSSNVGPEKAKTMPPTAAAAIRVMMMRLRTPPFSRT